MTDETALVEAGAKAAEEHILSAFRSSDIADLDITIQFIDDELEIDIYLDTNSDGEDVDQVVEDATLAAVAAIDNLRDSP